MITQQSSSTRKDHRSRTTIKGATFAIGLAFFFLVILFLFLL
jgi:hypothetical protein